MKEIWYVMKEKRIKKMLGLPDFTMQTGQATGPGAGRLLLGTFIWLGLCCSWEAVGHLTAFQHCA